MHEQSPVMPSAGQDDAVPLTSGLSANRSFHSRGGSVLTASLLFQFWLANKKPGTFIVAGSGFF